MRYGTRVRGTRTRNPWQMVDREEERRNDEPKSVTLHVHPTPENAWLPDDSVRETLLSSLNLGDGALLQAEAPRPRPPMSRPHGIAVFADRFGADRALERHHFETAEGVEFTVRQGCSQSVESRSRPAALPRDGGAAVGDERKDQVYLPPQTEQLSTSEEAAGQHTQSKARRRRTIQDIVGKAPKCLTVFSVATAPRNVWPRGYSILVLKRDGVFEGTADDGTVTTVFPGDKITLAERELIAHCAGSGVLVFDVGPARVSVEPGMALFANAELIGRVAKSTVVVERRTAGV